MSEAGNPVAEPLEMEFLGYDRGLTPIERAYLDLHRELAVLARQMRDETRPHYEPVLEQFAALAPRHIASVADAGALLSLGRGGWRVVSPAGSECNLIEQLHRDCDEGPGIDAARTKQTARVVDLAVETRWPRFTTSAAAQTSARSMLAIPLYTNTQTWGALLMLGSQVGTFGPDAEEAGQILATHAALTLEAMHQDRHYRSVLGSRDIIGQAKGVLMERFDIDVAAAFSLLTRLSEQSHRPVVVVAKELLETKAHTTG